MKLRANVIKKREQAMLERRSFHQAMANKTLYGDGIQGKFEKPALKFPL